MSDLFWEFDDDVLSPRRRVLVGSTIPAYAMLARPPHWYHWLENAEAITTTAARVGVDVEWLAVCQTDGRGPEPFVPLVQWAADLGVAAPLRVQWFSLDLGAAEWGEFRLTGICTGRNLIVDHAQRLGVDWVYFADSDVSAPDDVLPRLLELDYPVVGAHVPTYCLDGPRAGAVVGDEILRAGERGDVRVHWNTAGSLLVRLDVAVRVPWRWDRAANSTDDPATQGEMGRLGWPTLVRHDVACCHHPESIGPLEGRGHDLRVW